MRPHRRALSLLGRVTVLVLLLCPLGCYSERARTDDVADPLFKGQLSLTSPKTGHAVEAVYEYGVDAKSGDGEFRIYPKHQFDFPMFTYKTEAGQQFLLNVFSRYSTQVRPLICTEWEWGASGQCFVVFRLSPANRIEPVFSGVSRFGFRLLDLTGDGMPEIVGVYGDLGTDACEARIFSWHEGRFEETATEAVAVPHRYKIDGTNGR
jgi:hypothetical protein